MDDKDLKLIVKEIIHKEDIFDYSISTCRVVGTNVITIVVEFDDTTITFTLDNETGKVLGRQNSVKKYADISEPNVPVTDSVSVQLELYFELVNPVAIPQNSKNSPEITLCVDDKSMLQSFRIKSGQEDEDIISTIHKANRLVNYLSFKTGLYISHKHPRKVISGQLTTEPPNGFSMDAILTDLSTLDLTDPNLNEFLSTTSIDNLSLAHFAYGQRALNEKNYPEAIREFYLTIEDSGITEEIKYKKLRNAVSHKIICDHNSPEILDREFNIQLPEGGSLDITDPKIDGILEKESKNLREICWPHVAQTIQDLV